MMHLHVSEDAWTDLMTSGSLAVHKQRWGVTYTVAPPTYAYGCTPPLSQTLGGR